MRVPRIVWGGAIQPDQWEPATFALILAEFVPPPMWAEPDADEKPWLMDLQRLGRMHKAGALTDEEFEAAKKKLLG